MRVDTTNVQFWTTVWSIQLQSPPISLIARTYFRISKNTDCMDTLELSLIINDGCIQNTKQS